MESTTATTTPAATQASATFYRPQQPKEPHPFIANSATQQHHFDFDDNHHHQQQHPQQQQQQQQLSNTNSPTFGLLDNPTDTVAHLLDEQCFWNAEEHTNLGGGDIDFDWTSLGLDAFGTQLIQPGTFDLDLATQQCQSNQTLAAGLDLESELLLLGAGDMTAAALDGPPVAMESGQDLFSNFTTAGTSPHNSANHTPALNPQPPSSTSPSSTHSHSSQSNAQKRSAPGSDEDNDASQKRQRNTMAARRYRQRRLDRMAELEKKLADMTEERDDLRVKLARREAEVGALREVLSAKK